MGCNQFTRMNESNSIIFKPIVVQVIKAETNNNLSATNIISRIQSNKHPFLHEKNCMKIQIQNQFSDFILDDLLGINPIGRKLYNIRKYWLLYKACESYFESMVHAVCITNYNIQDGITVMLISAVAKLGFPTITFYKDPPYITFIGDYQKETNDIIKAWNEFAKILKAIHKKKVLKKFEKYKEIINDFLLKCDETKKWYIKKALKTSEDFSISVQKTFEGINSYYNLLDKMKRQVMVYSIDVNLLGRFNGANIVHYILNR
ncbi:hypothetical protein SteCoe_34828 [Stentor coeruleus]|uniref:Uncharacterized protein n=1 Tax=Stentor coeruleus TaxID=5963 RepID=A0A1R2AU10_9CILI|nr:hypothetical protein SteCoe_34828 [Stentor coeruleus]